MLILEVLRLKVGELECLAVSNDINMVELKKKIK